MGDPPEQALNANVVHGRFDKIKIPNGHPTRRQYDIMAYGLFERGARFFECIAGNGQGDGLTAGLTHGGGQGVGVGVHDLTRL